VGENGLIIQAHGVRRFSWKDASGAKHAAGASI
jgi:hypothetical protein